MTEAQVRAVLERHFPEFTYTDMDCGFFWKSLEKYEPGDIITHEGTAFRVLYSWEWWKPKGVQVYMCEMEPADAPSRRAGSES